MRIRRLLWVGLLALPLQAAAATPENFNVRSSQDLLALCSAAPSESLYREAVHFCHGYLVGAFHYMRASTSGPNSTRLVCTPDPPPSRNQAIEGFVAWLGQHPEFNGSLPVESMLRYLQETYPCNR